MSQPTAVVRRVETPTTRLILRDDGVLEARAVNPEIPRTAETVHTVMDTLAEVAGNDKRPVLWDIRGSTLGSPESMAVFVARVVEAVSAMGLLIDDGLGQELLSRVDAFSPAFEALLIPVRVFREEAEADAWLESFVGEK